MAEIPEHLLKRSRDRREALKAGAQPLIKSVPDSPVPAEVTREMVILAGGDSSWAEQIEVCKAERARSIMIAEKLLSWTTEPDDRHGGNPSKWVAAISMLYQRADLIDRLLKENSRDMAFIQPIRVKGGKP